MLKTQCDKVSQTETQQNHEDLSTIKTDIEWGRKVLNLNVRIYWVDTSPHSPLPHVYATAACRCFFMLPMPFVLHVVYSIKKQKGISVTF